MRGEAKLPGVQRGLTGARRRKKGGTAGYVENILKAQCIFP